MALRDLLDFGRYWQSSQVLPDDVSEQDLRNALSGVVRDGLTPITLSIGLTLLVIALMSLLLYPSAQILSFFSSYLSIALLFLVFSAVTQRWALPFEWAHPQGALLGLSLLLLCMLTMHVFPKEHHTTNFFLLIIGAGLFFLSTPWLFVIIIATFAGWTWSFSRLPDTPNWLQYGFSLILATAFAISIQRLRLRTLSRMEVMRLHDHNRSIELKNALTEVTSSKQELSELVDKLGHTNARLRLMLEQIPAIVWTTDSNLTINSSLGSGLRSLGLQPNQLNGTELSDYLKSREPGFLPLAAHQSALAGQPSHYEFEWQGTAYDCHVEPLRDTDGKIVGTLGLARDITKRKRAEADALRLNRDLERLVNERTEALRRNEESYRILFDENPSMYFTVDANGKILSVNHFGMSELGYARNELVGSDILKVFHPEDYATIREHLASCLEDFEFVHEWEGRKIRNDGSTIWVRESARAVRNPDGELILLIVCDNITARRQAEREARISQERLRALSLHLQQLLEEERRAIARDLHDDMGQMLTAMKMGLAVLKRKIDNTPSGVEMASEVEDMEKMASDGLTKVHALITELRPEVLDKLGLIPALEWQLNELQKRFGWRCDFQSEVAEVKVDKDHAIAVFRIVQESLTNVARHANAGRVMISISKNNTILWITIADNGKGISKGEMSAPGKFGLLGMRERAAVFDGRVSIVGVPGRGTTVTIKVPLAEQDGV